jgi:hypothetical protein
MPLSCQEEKKGYEVAFGESEGGKFNGFRFLISGLQLWYKRFEPGTGNQEFSFKSPILVRSSA